MIDCSKTENFLNEWYRLCKSKEANYGSCATCELWFLRPSTGCKSSVRQDPQKAIEIVQKWSNEHPQKTLLTEFLESYPNAELDDGGYPKHIIPCELGLMERKDICKNKCVYYYDNGYPCYDCWNTQIKEKETGKTLRCEG